LRELRSACIEFAEGYATNPGQGSLLLLVGHNGVGKTHVARALVNWANAAASKLPMVACGERMKTADAWFYSWPESVDSMKSGGWDIVEDMSGHALTVLDDVGAEHDPSRVAVEKFCQVLSRRERRWTIVTTNVAPALWPTRFDQRIASRFLRHAQMIDLSQEKDFFA
jgi:DNA replication protein DnaC